MLVTLLGIVTDVRLVQELNAEFPMLVTPAGMVTAEAVPMYFVMVTKPLAMMYSKFRSFSIVLSFSREDVVETAFPVRADSSDFVAEA